MLFKKKIFFFILFFLTQIMSLRFFYNFSLTKHSPEIYFYLYIFLSILIYAVLSRFNLIEKITSRTDLFYLIITLFTIYVYYKYPLSVGTERDDCYKIILNNLSNFNFPYSKTNLGDPCSTGLSGLIIYFPSHFYDNYFSFMTTFSFLLFYFFLKKYFDKSTVIFLIYIQIFNLLYLEEAIAGSDFFLISISYLIGIIYLNNYFKDKKKFDFIVAFIMLYFFYGSRIPFILLIPFNFIIFLIVYKNITVIKFFIYQFIASFFTIILPFIINSSTYHPLHIFNKGYSLLGLNFTFFLFLSLILNLLLIIYFYFKNNKFKSTVFYILNKYNVSINLLIFCLPILVIFIATFFLRLGGETKFKNWEGLSYFILIYPSFIFIYSLFLKDKKI